MKRWFKIGALLFLPLLLVSPFVGSIVVNNFVLWKFDRQLDQLSFMPELVDVEARGKRVSIGLGNGDQCSFYATRVVSLFDREENIAIFEKRLRMHKFLSAKDMGTGDSVELNYFRNGMMMVISISDGPYSPWFDFRCY
jgi:hypothetical protein